MVKKITIFFVYLLFFILSLMYFTPKSSIYFFLEAQLKQRDIIISSEKITDKGFTFDVNNANISIKSIESATVKQASVKIFALYNSFNLNEIVLSSTAKSFIPLHIDSVNIVYSIFNPLNIIAYGVGQFGEVNAKFNIVERTLHLNLKPSKKMLKRYRNTLRNLKKTDNGEFTYDQTF